MESDARTHVDAELMAGLLLTMAQEQSVEQLLQNAVSRVLKIPADLIAVIWLIDSGKDDAAGVPKEQPPGPTRYLYAVAGGASMTGPRELQTRMPDHLTRIPFGVGPIGRIAATGQSLTIKDLDTEPLDFSLARDWLMSEQIRGFNGAPIIYKDKMLGVYGVFDRHTPPDDAARWVRVFADHIAAAVVNARSFEEIRAAGKRLEQANQRLERELAERREAEQKLRGSEQRYRRIVDTASEGIWELNEQYTTTLVNQRMAEMLGYEPPEMAGKRFEEFLFEDDLADHQTRAAARRQGLAERFERKFRRKDGSTVWMQVSATPILDAEHRMLGSFAMMTDITERKQAEEALRRLNRELRAISNCNQVLLHATDEQSLLQEICRIVCEEAGYRVAWVGYAEHDEAQSVRSVASTGVEEGYLASLGIRWADTEQGRGPCGTAIRTGKTSCIQDYVTDPRGAPWKEVALRHGFRSAVALPLKDEQANTFGSLIIYSAQPNAFTSEEIRLLEELVGDLAFGIVALRSRAERKRAEEALRESERKYHELVEHANSIILHWRRDGRILHLNEFGQRFFGYTETEIRGRHVIGTIVPETDSSGRDLNTLIDGVCADPSAFEQNVNENMRRNGERAWIAWTNKVQLNSAGEVTEILSIGLDITARRRAEEEVRRTAAQWQATFDAVQDLVLLLDRDFRILRANRAAAEFLGLPYDKIVGGHCYELIHGTSTPPGECPLAQMCQSRRHEEVEVLARPGGSWLAVSVDPLFDASGELTQVVHVARDITDRKRTEEALRESEAYLAEAQRLSHTGSWAFDVARDEYVYASEECLRIFGFDAQEKLPTRESVSRLIPSEDWDEVDASYAKSVHEKVDTSAEFRITLPGGTVKHIQVIRHPILNDAGDVVKLVGTAVDVTERKQAEEELCKHREHLEDLVKQRTEELAEAKARAEAANRAKSEFLSSMSHELRTPLNAVLGFSRLLTRGPDVTPRQQEALDIILRSGEHLLNLINNVLDMAKIESGRVVLEESEVNLYQLLHEMQSLLGVGAAGKGLHFVLEPDSDLPRFVAVDAGKLRQVLLNLVGNAIKYTESGGIKLRATVVGRNGAETAQVRFEVEDSGPGIRPEDCQRIFFPFVQLGGPVSTQAGTGLGLAICKQYVELMGGQIGVASEPGRGSIFYFHLPVRVLPTVTEPEEPKHGRVVGLAEGQPRYRMLIVEDQPENRLLLRRLLDPLGCELREATNGQEAVALFEQWHPDLIWMDIRMPVMDGMEAVRRIRATEAGAATKIIALTAHALEEEKGPILAVGCDDLVRKPFREQELFDALARHLRLRFLYEKTPCAETTLETPGLALRTEQLAALPAQLRQELRQAVIELDTARTQALIEQVSARDAALGRALHALATRLDYPSLLRWLEQGHSQTGETL